MTPDLSLLLRPREAKELPERRLPEILDSLRHGRLFQIVRVHARKITVQRIRSKKGEIYRDKTRDYHIERTETSVLPPTPGDFAFVSQDGTWSIWKVEQRDTVDESLAALACSLKAG